MNNMNPTKKTRGGGTQVVANDKQSISLIRHLQCYLYNQYVLDTTPTNTNNIHKIQALLQTIMSEELYPRVGMF